MIDQYDWAGGREAMLRFGPATGPVVIAALPLFEEANRTRAFVVTILRTLAARGIASALPDLPGQGESLQPLHGLSLLRIAEGYEGAVDHLLVEGRRVYGAGIRSAALIDKCGLVFGRWHFAPQEGSDLLRDLGRTRQLSYGSTEAPGEFWYLDPAVPDDAEDPPVVVAGNLISPALLTDLSVYSPWQASDGGSLRTVRLNTDPRQADRHVPGAPLWRRSEPGNDPALAALLADDIAAWITRCEG